MAWFKYMPFERFESLRNGLISRAVSTSRGQLPVIFYIGVPDPGKGVPPGAFGLTHVASGGVVGIRRP